MSLALITGSSGLVGSETSKFFIDKGFEVIGIDNNERKILFGNDGDTTKIKNTLKKNKLYKHYNINVTKYSLLEKIFKKYKKKLGISVKKKIIIQLRVGDHQWYISDISKFKKFYPNYKLKYNVPMILDEIIDAES